MEAKIRIGGEIFLYRAKAPFVASGVSILGALEYDEGEDKVRCHECGAWHAALGGHVWSRHAMTAQEYKDKHGLNRSSALCSEAIRVKLVNHGRASAAVQAGAIAGLRAIGPGRRHEHPYCSRGRVMNERRNKLGSCKAQLLEKLAVLGRRVGRTPSREEMCAAGIYPQSIEFAFGMKLREIMPLTGMLPQRRYRSRRRYTKELLAELMRDFWVKSQRVPSGSDYRRGSLPSQDTYCAYFGTMEQAYFSAGLELEVKLLRNQQQAAQRVRGTPEYTEKELIGLLRGFIELRGRRPGLKDYGSEVLRPSDKTFRRRLGSLPAIFSAIEGELGLPGGGVIPRLGVPC